MTPNPSIERTLGLIIMSLSASIRRIPIPVVVALVFSTVISVGLLLAYGLSYLPSREESCRAECIGKHKTWRLVPKYPRHMLPDGKNPAVVCECY